VRHWLPRAKGFAITELTIEAPVGFNNDGTPADNQPDDVTTPTGLPEADLR
jgi:hypothetical protein